MTEKHTIRNKLKLPWKEPSSVYDDDGPLTAVSFEVQGVCFLVKPTEHIGCNTGRTRFWVECLTCGEVLHEATTSATYNIESHLEEAHGWEPWISIESLLKIRMAQYVASTTHAPTLRECKLVRLATS